MALSSTFESETLNIMELAFKDAVDSFRSARINDAPDMKLQETQFESIIRVLVKEAMSKIFRLHKEKSETLQNENKSLTAKVRQLEEVMTAALGQLDMLDKRMAATPSYVVHNGLLYRIRGGVRRKKGNSPLSEADSNAILNAAMKHPLSTPITKALSKWTKPKVNTEDDAEHNIVESAEMESHEAQQDMPMKENKRSKCDVPSTLQNQNEALKAEVAELKEMVNTIRMECEKAEQSQMMARATHVVYNGLLFELKLQGSSKSASTPSLTEAEKKDLLNAAKKQQVTPEILKAVKEWSRDSKDRPSPNTVEKKREKISGTEQSNVNRGPVEADYQCNSIKSNENYVKQTIKIVPNEKVKRFQCDVCDKRFALKRNLQIHINSIHINEKPFACDKCGDRFRVQTSLDNHLLKHKAQDMKTIEKNTIKCKVCEVKFHTRMKLRCHVDRLHPEMREAEVRPFTCVTCGKKFTTKRNLAFHHLSHTGEKPFKCTICGECFRACSGLVVHKRKHTGERPFKCSHCDKTFTSQVALTRHRAVHSQTKEFVCETCGARFSFQGNLQRHIRLHTGAKPYSCQVCGMSFTQANNLKSHMVCHGAPKPFMCDLCGKTFLYNCKLLTHTKLVHKHETEGKTEVVRPFSCELCPKSYSTSCGLKRHQETHSGREYNCTFCEKSFNNKFNFQYHQRVHLEGKCYACDICGKNFQTSQVLSSHMLLHTAEKPHACEYCGRTFRIRANMRRHARIHTGDKPFECETCNRRFTQSNQLKAHMQIHTGVKMYSCCKCGKGFSDSRYLKKHTCTNQ